MPDWVGTATLLAFAGWEILGTVLIVDVSLERWKGRSFLPFTAHVALLVVLYVTLFLWLGGWSLYNIIMRDPYWEPFAIIGLWIAAVMLIFLPAYFFLLSWHVQRQRRAQSRSLDM